MCLTHSFEETYTPCLTYTLVTLGTHLARYCPLIFTPRPHKLTIEIYYPSALESPRGADQIS